MDLSKETNVEKLKAAAYDQLALKEQTERNLQAINQRIAQITQEEQEKQTEDKAKKA